MLVSRELSKTVSLSIYYEIINHAMGLTSSAAGLVHSVSNDSDKVKKQKA